MEKSQQADKKKEHHEEPRILISYTKDEMEEMIKPHGKPPGGCGCSCGCS
jgi:hypothetical protein